VVESSTLAFLQSPAARRDRPDLVLLDPPRAGLGAEATAALARVRSQTITYVSCDPATLGRDLAGLLQAGYTLTRLSLVDMFPQTFHLETVATLHLR
jgi:23S rRNA (uracil1939-C5)-methyltransferase